MLQAADLAELLKLPAGAGLPSPFDTGTGVSASTPIIAVQNACHGLFAWLDGIGGRSADAIFEDAYRSAARQFGAADGFPVVLAMLLQRRLTADKISLLRRSQIEHVLRDKNAALESAKADLQQAHDLLEERVRERTRALERAKAEADASDLGTRPEIPVDHRWPRPSDLRRGRTASRARQLDRAHARRAVTVHRPPAQPARGREVAARGR